jgi:hypothetical protein
MARGQEAPIGTQITLPSGYVNEKTAEGEWKLVHRLVMERHLGRPLARHERVCFINKDADKANPTIDDLELRVIKKRTLAAKEKRVAAIKEELLQLLEDIDADTGS